MSGCAISGIMSEAGNCFRGRDIIDPIANMHEDSNGLGAGFAASGIYQPVEEGGFLMTGQVSANWPLDSMY